jgi:glutaminyl-peptide cyclotransferase
MKYSHIILLISLFLISCEESDRGNRDAALTFLNKDVYVPDFNEENAFAYILKQVEFGPRNPGSAGHQQCLQFLTFELQKYADAVVQQPFRHTGYGGQSYQMTNIIASFNLAATGRIVLGAHWDTRPRAERDPDPGRREEPILGANDGGSGVAVLLELARVLHENPPPIGVDIILFDGEDYGREGDLDNYCLGSKYFARNLPPQFKPRFGIIIDMVGDKEARFPREGYSRQYVPWVVDLIWNTANSLNLLQFEDRNGTPIYDDHVPLNEAGIPTALIIDSDLIGYDGPDVRRRYWHTTHDTPEQCSPESLGAVGTLLTEIVFRQPVRDAN